MTAGAWGTGLPSTYSGGYMRSGTGVTRWLVAGVLAAGTVGAVLAIAGVSTPARVPLVLIFLAGVPAVAAASLLGGLDRLARIVIAGTSAIVINFGVAETMIAAGHWSPRAGVAAVAALSLLVAGAGALTRRSPGRGRPAGPAIRPSR